MLNYPLYFWLNTNNPDLFNIVISSINIELNCNTVLMQSFDYNIVHIIVIKGYLELIRLKTKNNLHIYL